MTFVQVQSWKLGQGDFIDKQGRIEAPGDSC
jgi:hypothetical protein